MDIHAIKKQSKLVLNGCGKELAIPVAASLGVFFACHLLLSSLSPLGWKLGLGTAAYIAGALFALAFLSVSYDAYIGEFCRRKTAAMQGYCRPAIDRAPSVALSWALFAPLFLAGLLFWGIPSAIACLAFGFVPNAIASSERGAPFRQILKAAFGPMRGHLRDVFLFYWHFAGLLLLIPLTFGLAAIVVAPYFAIAKTIFFDSLTDIYLKDYIKIYTRKSRI